MVHGSDPLGTNERETLIAGGVVPIILICKMNKTETFDFVGFKLQI